MSELRRSAHRRRQVLAALLERDGRCMAPVCTFASRDWPAPWSVGHVVPLSRGGTDELVRLEHLRCNVSAGNRAPRVRAYASTIADPRKGMT